MTSRRVSYYVTDRRYWFTSGGPESRA